MCRRDLVARGKPTAHPRKQREAVPGLARVGIVVWLPLGVVPPPSAGAYERSLNSRSRYHALRGHPLDIGGFRRALYSQSMSATSGACWVPQSEAYQPFCTHC